jgi:hypothetical protein
MPTAFVIDARLGALLTAGRATDSAPLRLMPSAPDLTHTWDVTARQRPVSFTASVLTVTDVGCSRTNSLDVVRPTDIRAVLSYPNQKL